MRIKGVGKALKNGKTKAGEDAFIVQFVVRFTCELRRSSCLHITLFFSLVSMIIKVFQEIKKLLSVFS